MLVKNSQAISSPHQKSNNIQTKLRFLRRLYAKWQKLEEKGKNSVDVGGLYGFLQKQSYQRNTSNIPVDDQALQGHLQAQCPSLSGCRCLRFNLGHCLPWRCFSTIGPCLISWKISKCEKKRTYCYAHIVHYLRLYSWRVLCATSAVMSWGMGN